MAAHKSNAKFDGVAFDEIYAGSLIESTRYSDINDAPKIVRNRYHESLFALLMYDKVWLPSDFKRRYEPENLAVLLSEGYADFIPFPILQSHRRLMATLLQKADSAYIKHSADRIYISESEAEEALDDFGFYLKSGRSALGLVKELVWDYYNRRKGGKGRFSIEELVDFGFVTSLMRAIGPDLLLEDEWADSVVGEHQEVYVESCVNDAVELTQGWTDDELAKELRFEYDYSFSKRLSRKAMIRVLSGKVRDDAEHSFERDWEHFLFINSYLKLKELLEFSAQHQVPIKGAVARLPKSKDAQRFDADTSYRVYRLMLEEVRYMPHLRNLDDVRRLRDDKRIKRFREVVGRWSDNLRSGNGKEEKQLRDDIRLANSDLRKLPRYHQISGWLTYLALPLYVIDVMIGFPVGAILTAVGAAYEFKSHQIQKENSWLLLGSPLG